MSRNAWIIFSVMALLVLGGLVWMSQGSRLDISDVDANAVQSAEERNGEIGEHTIGNPEAKVTIIEYGDFQCPGCASAAPVLESVAEKYSEDVVLAFRNFPLSSIHPNARAAAAAAEAAGLQGKYWEMHFKLFASQNEWGNLSGAQRTDMFEVYARELGLDADKLRDDLGLDSIAAKINFDTALGKEQGVTGTPTIFVNGEKVSDWYALDGEKVDASVEGSNVVWQNADDFERAVILPALEKAGVKVD